MVQQAVQDGIGDGGLPDDSVPVFDRALAGDDRGIFLIAILDDFEEIIALRVVERSQEQIIEDEQLDLGESGQHLEMRAIGLSRQQHFEQTRSAQIEDGVTLAGGEVAKRTGDVAFADTRWVRSGARYRDG